LQIGPTSAIHYALQWGISMGFDALGLAAIDILGKEEAARLATEYGFSTIVHFYEGLHESVDDAFRKMRSPETPVETAVP